MALETQAATADMATAYDNDLCVRFWLEGYAAAMLKMAKEKEAQQ